MLAHINLNSNALAEIPYTIFTSLPNLKFLDVSHNKLTHIPASLGAAISLVEVHFQGNQIRELPQSIGNLRKLEILDLKSNKLENLPVEFGLLERLLKLNLEENNLKRI